MYSPVLPKIFLFRHGETEWSRTGRHTSRSEIPLTSHGEEEARTLSQKIDPTSFGHVWVSPRTRAQRTSELAGLGKFQVELALQEWDYGDFEGLTSQEIRAKQPSWNLFQHGAPNGETPAAVAARVDALLQRLTALEGNVALFSHGHLLRALGARWAQWPVTAGQRLYLSTGSISVLGYEHQNRDEPVIEFWNAR